MLESTMKMMVLVTLSWLVAIALAPSSAVSQVQSVLPPNSYSIGSTWVCHPGYRREGNLCVGIFDAIGGRPAHSYVYGSNWDCHPGYRKVGNRCDAIAERGETLPSDSSGRPVPICDPGYRAEETKCIKRTDTSSGPPPNGFAYGSEWACNPGYRKDADRCVGIFGGSGAPPANSHLYGSSWECDPGFRKEGDRCSSIANAEKPAVASVPNAQRESAPTWHDKPSSKPSAPKKGSARPKAAGSDGENLAGLPAPVRTPFPPWQQPSIAKRPPISPAVDLEPSVVFERVATAIWIVNAFQNIDALTKGAGERSQGSAVAVTHDRLLTNCHVLKDKPLIVLSQGKTYIRAFVEGADFQADRCLLRVTDATLTAVPGIRTFSDLKVGERVYTVGAPKGLERTMGEGIVSGVRLYKQSHVVQTTAPISPGSSGGGLFDRFGNLVGITMFLLREAQSLNFAIAADEFWKP